MAIFLILLQNDNSFHKLFCHNITFHESFFREMMLLLLQIISFSRNWVKININ